MSRTNPEICNLINDHCFNELFCGSCPVAREKLLGIDEFKNVKKIQFSNYSQTNRIAILFAPTVDSQNNPYRLIIASVSRGELQLRSSRSGLSRF